MTRKIDILTRFKIMALTVLTLGASSALLAQDSVEWLTLGNDFAHTRYSKANEITFNNFDELEVVWEWDGVSLGAVSGRSTPSYINGILYTVAGPRRHVVAIDPKTGEAIWSYRLPNTGRWEYSMRADYGKGIGYSEVDGRGVVYMVTPVSYTHLTLPTNREV